MAQIIKIKRGLKSTIEDESTVLQYGELAVATDTLKVYFGQSDGQKVVLNPDGGTAETAQKANKLTVARAINLSGAVTGTTNFDGSQDVTIETILESVGTSGTYYKVTTDDKGRVTGGITQLQVEDLPEIPYTKITGLGDIVTHNVNEFATSENLQSLKTELIGTGSGTSTTIKGVYDEAKSYTDQQINTQISSVYKPAGTKTFEELPELAVGEEGKVYNISNEFTTTENFVEGAGKKYPAGTNVVCVDSDDSGTYKWDVLSGFVDLSAYETTVSVDEKIESAKTELIGNQEGVTSTNIKSGVKEAKDYADTLNTTINEKITQVTEKVTNIETALGGSIPENIVKSISEGNGISVSGDGKDITISAKIVSGNGLTLDESGISMNIATESTPGSVQPDNDSIKISGNIISVNIIDGGLIE